MFINCIVTSEWLLEIIDEDANDCISSFNNGINILILMPDAAGDENRVVVSAVDLARIESSFRANAAPPNAPSIPWWGRVIGWFLALSFPLLCIFSIGIRYAIRRKEYRVREAWKGFLCTLLIVSGLTNLGAFVAYAILRPASFNKQQRLAITPDVSDGLELSERLPQFPTAGTMTSVEIAARTKRLVFIVTPDIGIDPRRETLGMAQIGAGVLLMANDSGFLVGTNRHVIDPSGAFHFSAKDGEAMVISNAWEYARARVIARHQDLDLALLWVLRRGGSDRFRQPITPYGSIPVGDPVFVVGHPQRLFFTLSNGLISRVDGDALQLSAPISPGNSGGPVYDSYGNLLGIVTSKLDREITPNAENLNFATRADAFLDEAGWKFLDHGQERLRQFSRREGDSLDMANINVTVYDSTENKRVPVELPDDAPANKIIAVLIDKLRLPKNGPDAAPLSYKFHHKNSGRQIQDAQTLSAAGVQDGDILRLQPEITAGRMH